MGNRYMKPNQSVNDLCKKQIHLHPRMYSKRTYKSIEVIPNKTKSFRFKFLTRSLKKKKDQTANRPTTTDRVLIRRQRYLYSKDSIFISNSDPDLNIADPKDLGFAIIRECNKNDSLEYARQKYCYMICTSTPKKSRFNALIEFEKLFQRKLNDYGSDISSISTYSIELPNVKEQDNEVETHQNVIDGKEVYQELDNDGNVLKGSNVDQPSTDLIEPKPSSEPIDKPFGNTKDLHPKRIGTIRPRPNTNFINLCRKMSLDSKKISEIGISTRPLPSCFNIMIVGERNIGKTTLIYSLLELPEKYQPSERLDNSMDIYTISVVRGAHEMVISMVDTPGLNDEPNNKSCYSLIEEYLIKVMQEPKKTIHGCIYCISPSDKELRQSDIVNIKQLESRVNIIPVLAKVDSLPVEDLTELKRSMKESIDKHLMVFQIPGNDISLDRESKFIQDRIKRVLPFSVIGSMQHIKTKEGIIRGRKYPWGLINIDNPTHCDTYWLKKFLFEMYPSNLVAQTHKLLAIS